MNWRNACKLGPQSKDEYPEIAKQIRMLAVKSVRSWPEEKKRAFWIGLEPWQQDRWRKWAEEYDQDQHTGTATR